MVSLPVLIIGFFVLGGCFFTSTIVRNLWGFQNAETFDFNRLRHPDLAMYLGFFFSFIWFLLGFLPIFGALYVAIPNATLDSHFVLQLWIGCSLICGNIVSNIIYTKRAGIELVLLVAVCAGFNPVAVIVGHIAFSLMIIQKISTRKQLFIGTVAVFLASLLGQTFRQTCESLITIAGFVSLWWILAKLHTPDQTEHGTVA